MGHVPRTLRDTLVGSGFLREAPQNVRAMMRRCIMMPNRQMLVGPVVPITHRHRSHPSFEWSAQLPAPAPGAWASPAPPRAAEPARARRNRQAMPETVPDAVPAAYAVPWWDDPVTIGALLVAMPPIGLAALWASRHYGKEARWAISGMMGLMLTLLAAIAVALMLR
jgi:hypothetical protein